jgi:hypothetical protein
VWIVWSGIHDSSDPVRRVRRYEASRQIDETLVLPAELVSTEAPNQYITIRVQLPESALSAIKTVKPGEWVTVTSRHRPATDEEAVIAVRPYGATTTTNCFPLSRRNASRPLGPVGRLSKGERQNDSPTG